MGLISKGWTAAFAALGLATFSQAPEFSQQYKQRLGGGIEELSKVVQQFDNDADATGLNRQGAIDTLEESDDELVQLRGKSMKKVVSRYENLIAQRNQMNQSIGFMQPINLMRYPDPDIVTGTYEGYKPAVPLTAEAASWGAIGALFFGLFGRLPISVSRARRKRKLRQEQEARLLAHQEAQRIESELTLGEKHVARLNEQVKAGQQRRPTDV